MDAPLGLPQAFVESTTRQFRSAVPRFSELPLRVIENRLAYRDTERAVFAAFNQQMRPGWRPLSSSFDLMGSNVSKARTAASQLRAVDPTRVRVVPFESDTTQVAVLEVYPALWGAFSRDSVDASVADVLESAKVEASADIRDGVLCALAAACYERTRLAIGGRPEIIMPRDDDDRARVEGWIYAPRPSEIPIFPGGHPN